MFAAIRLGQMYVRRARPQLESSFNGKWPVYWGQRGHASPTDITNEDPNPNADPKRHIRDGDEDANPHSNPGPNLGPNPHSNVEDPNLLSNLRPTHRPVASLGHHPHRC